MMIEDVKRHPGHNYMWSYVSGLIAGMGSAMGALAFPHIELVEVGAVVAGVFGLIAAAGAIYVFNKKIDSLVPAMSVIGFMSPPLLIVMFFI
jgi:hypothetical protein